MIRERAVNYRMTDWNPAIKRDYTREQFNQGTKLRLNQNEP